MDIDFLLNAERVTLRDVDPTTTLLDWLRDERGLTGTKEGCNEGDCGACTVMVTDPDGARALNACILFLPQLHGKAVRTVEGIAGPDGTLHPVQRAMIDHHGSQCGFCTPGFVVSMATAHLNGDRGHDDALAGNLCRCTGYAPIIRAAEAAADAAVPDWIRADTEAFAKARPGDSRQDTDRHDDTRPNEGTPDDTPPPFFLDQIPPGEPRASAAGAEPPTTGDAIPQAALAPRSADALAEAYARQPDATLIAGATDVGLWVTKQMRDLGPVIFLNRCADLREVADRPDGLRIGAMVTMDRMLDLMRDRHPAYAEMIRRYGSAQVRAAATVGGNIANGSPIGDNPPALIALDARLHLRRGDSRRSLPIEDFFLDYGRQDRARGEFVEAVTIPAQHDRLRVYKLSKRFDQDISAVCGAFRITVEDGTVTEARIAFGGMAGIPARAAHVEAAITGKPWAEDTLIAAWDAWEADFQPLSDMRASAEYRLATARHMLARVLLEDLGATTSVLQVSA